MRYRRKHEQNNKKMDKKSKDNNKKVRFDGNDASDGGDGDEK